MNQAVAVTDNKDFTRDPIEYFLYVDTELVEYIEKITPGYTDKYIRAVLVRRETDPHARMTASEFTESFGLFMKIARNSKTISENKVPYDVAKKMVRRLYGWFFHELLDPKTHVQLARKIPKGYRAKTYSKVRFKKRAKYGTEISNQE